MKKLFFAICFITIATGISTSRAAVTELRTELEAQQRQAMRNIAPVEDKSIPKNYEDFKRYIRERAQKVPKLPMEVIEKASTMNAQRSSEYISSQTSEKKSTFQKIYEEALSKLDSQNNAQPQDFITYSLPERPSSDNQKQEWENESLEVINVKLPNGEDILAPAKEHIPYLASRIEIMPNGLIRIKEIVNVIANGEKLKYGLSKALPKYSVSRTGVRNRVIPYLNGVKINGKEIDYELRDSYDRYIIAPTKELPLRPGIYTYEFDYMLDRKLWYYDNFNEFYWDVTGSFWNLVIAKSVATLRTPVNAQTLDQTLFVGYAPNQLSSENTAITIDPVTNSLGFVSTMPLFAGEGMHILVSLPKNGFIDPDFNKKFEWFIEDYGDIIFTLFGFLAILIAYIISWRDINSGTTQTKISVQKNPAMLRMLLKGKYDNVSFISFLLDLYRKNMIDIEEKDQNILLIKKIDNTKKLNPNERKAFNQIFPKKEIIFTLNRSSGLNLKRISKYIEKDTNKRIKILSLKLNSGYILLSGGMLLLSIIAISSISVCPWQTFALIMSSTIIMAVYVWLLMMKIKTRWLNILTKIISVIFIIIAGLFLSTKIHTISTIFIAAMLYTILIYTRLFAKRNGLIKNNILEAQNFSKYLKENSDKIILGHEFKNQQPYIYALGEQAHYAKSPTIEKVYKLDLADKIKNML